MKACKGGFWDVPEPLSKRAQGKDLHQKGLAVNLSRVMLRVFPSGSDFDFGKLLGVENG